MLNQAGNIVDEFLDNQGTIHGQSIVGKYDTDMRFNGHNHTATFGAKKAWELEYVYEPFPGLSVVSAIFVDDGGAVLGTQVLSESSAGGSSTVGDNDL